MEAEVLVGILYYFLIALILYYIVFCDDEDPQPISE